MQPLPHSRHPPWPCRRRHLFPVGCAGLITHAEPLSDGRYNIVLRGLEKFRVLDDDDSRGYRVARIETMTEDLNDEERASIRVERRRLNNTIHYRIVGIVWGGQAPARALQIRFGSRDAWKPLELCPAPTSNTAWSLWSYRWTPTEPGVYNIAIRSADTSVRTRRLDVFFYARRVRVDGI